MLMTLLPHEGFMESALALDYATLRQQRYNAWKIYQLLTTSRERWEGLPGVTMWRGHEAWLVGYGVACCTAFSGSRSEDALLRRFRELASTVKIALNSYPLWLGDPLFHLSHRSYLISQDPDYYGQMWAGVPPTLPLIWPV